MKNTKVVVLKGTSDSGKTTTLKALIEKYETTEFFKYKGYSEKDAYAKVKQNGKTIGIITAGDNAEELKSGFSVLLGCDIYVCASRTKGGAKDYIKKNFKETNILWIEKWSVKEDTFLGTNVERRQKKANRLQVEEIYDILDELTK